MSETATAEAETTSAETQSASTATVQEAEWSWVKPDGKLNDGWLDHLPDDVKPNGTKIAGLVDKYGGSLPSLLNGALHLQGVAGRKLSAPTSEWTPEQVAEYRNAHGIPDSADKYDLTPPEGSLPEGWKWNPDTFAPMREWALKNHVPAAALKEWTAVQAGIDKARQQAAFEMVQEADNKTLAELKKEFGPNFEKRWEQAENVGTHLGIDMDVNSNPIANHPQFIKAIDAFAQRMSESQLKTIESNASASVKPDRVLADDIMQGRHEKSADYLGKNGPERQDAAIKYVMDLLKNSEGK